MATAMETSKMAKAKGRPKLSERDDVTIKFDRTIANKAKMVALHRGISAAELLSELARGPVDKAYAQMLRELDAGK